MQQPMQTIIKQAKTHLKWMEINKQINSFFFANYKRIQNIKIKTHTIS